MSRAIQISFFISAVLLLGFGEVHAQKRRKKKSKKEKLTYLEERKADEYFIDGMKHYMLEEYDKALIMFKKAYAIDPKNAATNYQIAHILESRFNFDLALPYAEHAYENGKDNPYYYRTLANVYINLNRLKDAAKVYEKLVKNFKNQEEYLFELAEIYVRIDEPDQALEVLEKFTKAYGPIEEVTLFKQKIHLREQNIEEAIKEGKKLISMNPFEPMYVINQVKLLDQNGQRNEGKKLLEEFLEANENSRLRLMLYEFQLADGETEKATQNYLEAFKSPELEYDDKIDLIAFKVRELPKDSGLVQTMCAYLMDNYPDRSKTHAIYGDYHQLLGHKVEARDMYASSIVLENSNFSVWQQLILLDAELEHYDSLIQHTERGLELFPNQAVFWYFNGSAYLIQKKYEKSVYAFEKAKKLAFGNAQLAADINAQLGDAYNGLKKYEESDMAYDEALRYNQNNPHVLNNYSYFLSLRNEKLEKAMDMSERLIQQNPENKTYLDTRAWVLFKNEEYKKALELLEKAVDDNSSAEVIEHYGDALFKNNRIEEAIIQWKKAKDLGGDPELLNRKIQDKKLYE